MTRKKKNSGGCCLVEIVLLPFKILLFPIAVMVGMIGETIRYGSRGSRGRAPKWWPRDRRGRPLKD